MGCHGVLSLSTRMCDSHLLVVTARTPDVVTHHYHHCHRCHRCRQAQCSLDAKMVAIHQQRRARLVATRRAERRTLLLARERLVASLYGPASILASALERSERERAKAEADAEMDAERRRADADADATRDDATGADATGAGVNEECDEECGEECDGGDASDWAVMQMMRPLSRRSSPPDPHCPIEFDLHDELRALFLPDCQPSSEPVAIAASDRHHDASSGSRDAHGVTHDGGARPDERDGAGRSARPLRVPHTIDFVSLRRAFRRSLRVPAATVSDREIELIIRHLITAPAPNNTNNTNNTLAASASASVGAHVGGTAEGDVNASSVAREKTREKTRDAAHLFDELDDAELEGPSTSAVRAQGGVGITIDLDELIAWIEVCAVIVPS